MADRASAAQFSAGLDDDSQTNKETRGVDDASDANDVVNNNANQGAVLDVEDDKLPELTPDYEEVDSDSNDEEDSVHDEEFDEDSVGDEEPTVSSTGQRTSSGRVSRPPNRLNPTMTGKIRGNSRDEGVDFPLVGKYQSDDDRDNIYYQYACAGYSTKQGVVHFNVNDDAPPLKVMT